MNFSSLQEKLMNPLLWMEILICPLSEMNIFSRQEDTVELQSTISQLDIIDIRGYFTQQQRTHILLKLTSNTHQHIKSTIQSMEFSGPEYCSEQLFPSPGNLPNPGIKPRSPTLQANSLPAESLGKPKNTGMGSLSLFQQILLTQESKQGLLHCRQILYQLSYQGSLCQRNKEEK